MTAAAPPTAKVLLIHAYKDSRWAVLLGQQLPQRARERHLAVDVVPRYERHLAKPDGSGVGDLRRALQGAAAMVFLLSDELLASPFVQTGEPATLFLEARKAMPAFGVSCSPLTRHAGFLGMSSFGLSTVNEAPLSTLDQADVDRTLQEVTESIITGITADVPNESASEASSNAPPRRVLGARFAAQRATKRAPIEGEEADEEDGVVPLARLSEFTRADSIGFLMDRAVEIASGAAPARSVTTSFVLFAFTEPMKTEGNWAAPFIRDLILGQTSPSRYEAMRDGYLKRKGTQGLRTKQGSRRTGVPQNMTRNVFAAFQHARDIAEKTTGRSVIHARHLLAALLTTERTSALRRVDEMDISPSAIREAFFDWARGQGDTDTAWVELLLGVQPAVRRLSGFSTDRVGGEDLLNIEPDVRALAALIAARTVAPPLSIGLFGEWGSGKTFFMRELRTAINGFAQEARDENKMQRELPFYKHIVQIEFNAWHYVEGNLWASLVEHILDNLYPNEDRTGVRTLQAKLIQKLADEKTLSQATSNAVDNAKLAATQAEQELSAARTELDKKTSELASLNAERVGRAFELTGAQAPVELAMEQLGLGEVGKSAVALESALRQIHDVVNRGHRFAVPLMRAKDRKSRFTWLFLSLLGAPVVAIIVRFVLQKLGSSVTDIYAYATGAATLIASGVPWLKKQAEWMSARLDEAEKAQKAFDAEMAQQTAKHVEKVTEAEQKVRELTSALDAASQKHAEAKSREAAAEAELKAATTGRLLANFISDRASSTDYRKHLGVLALVRDDFEKLSAFIEEVNWTLSPDDPADKPRSDGVKRFSTLPEEEVDKEGRINRIVLYIDDLDRCPPNKVVEVLQAVHLLLAFPLFVVVVGVDARWITRSLQTRYRELLLLTDKQALDTNDVDVLPASPNDYLEKIFQIPFWLRPMDSTASDNMVRGLLKSSMAREKRESSDAADPSPTPGTGGAEPNAKDTPTDAGGSPETARDTAAALGSQSSEKQPGKSTASTTEQQKKLALESLEIFPPEIDFMRKLAAVLGRSPRAIKRFANVYRLIKVGLPESEQRTFLRPRDRLSNYQIVLFLLAVDTGAPAVARTFFSTIQEGAATEPSGGISSTTGAHNVLWLTKELTKRVKKTEEIAAWKQLKDWLLANRDIMPPDTDLADLAPWTKRVARYSFEVGRG